MFKGNKIYKIDKNGNKKRIFFVKGLKIKFKGHNSTVIIHEPFPRFKSSLLKLGDNSSIKIGSSKHSFRNFQVVATAPGQRFKMGKDCSLERDMKILLHKSKKLSVVIGDECMFATNIIFRTSDSHSILNLETNEIENPSKSIKIGSHCWFGENTMVLKGVTIADNCILGAGSIATKDCTTPNSIYAGIPAKLIKTNVKWSRELLE